MGNIGENEESGEEKKRCVFGLGGWRQVRTVYTSSPWSSRNLFYSGTVAEAFITRKRGINTLSTSLEVA